MFNLEFIANACVVKPSDRLIKEVMQLTRSAGQGCTIVATDTSELLPEQDTWRIQTKLTLENNTRYVLLMSLNTDCNAHC